MKSTRKEWVSLPKEIGCDITIAHLCAIDTEYEKPYRHEASSRNANEQA
jgi:hypothetical protein